MPNRILKESICRSEEVNSLTWFEEVLFYRLIVACDDYGRFDGRAAVIKGYCFPLKDVTTKDIGRALERLAAAGLARVYMAQGRPVLQLSTWERHQQVRAKKSKYPEPEENITHPEAGCSNGSQLMADDGNDSRNRETRIRNDGDIPPVPRQEGNVGRITHFHEFCEAYPKMGAHCPGAQYAYCRVLAEDGRITEEALVAAAANYAEAVRILGRTERYIRSLESFLTGNFFAGYLPGQYVPPEAVEKKRTGQKNRFHNFARNDYDFDTLEKELLGNG